MIKRDFLEQYLGQLLEVNKFDDYGPNGLQIEGQAEIKKLAFAVSATVDSIQQAQDWGADALIVHHGLFWKFHGPKTITSVFAKRVRPLIKNDINLFGYHLPLDAHLEVGNAAALALALGLEDIAPFGEHKGAHLGVKASFKDGASANAFKKTLEGVLQHNVIHSSPEKSEIKTVGIITGGANSHWKEALNEGLDAYITGEISEHDWHDAKEAGIHYFAGGHHATEVFGPKALMRHLQERFEKKGCEYLFIPSANPA